MGRKGTFAVVSNSECIINHLIVGRESRNGEDEVHFTQFILSISMSACSGPAKVVYDVEATA